VVEHSLGKGEVESSSLSVSSIFEVAVQGGSNSVVESQPSKLLVAGPIPVSRSKGFAGEISLSVKYGQPELQVEDPQRFTAVKAAIENAFSSSRVAGFLKSLERAKLRIRDFEIVLGKGSLGPSAAAEYNHLGGADQGQIRELYLASLEHVAPELRQKFFKLYAYY
jgi:hypothetical protein